jgi:hypothetical protein
MSKSQIRRYKNETKEEYEICCRRNSEIQNRPEVAEKKSKKRAQAIAEGRFEPHSNYIYGYYRDEYFQSAYEYRMMRVFVILEMKYLRKHGIRISWYNSEVKRICNYPPDFLVNGSEIVETKGWDSESVQLKAEATRKFVTESNERYKSYSLLFDIDIVEWEKKAVEKLGWTYEQYRVQIEKELSYYEQKRNKKRVYLRSLRKEAA